jgi:glycosyltransferase involved in cell wall biosynthesis
MVGDGPLSDEARQEADRLGVTIQFTGFRSDAPRVAAAFDVFVISSLYEGLGRALTEALVSGRPVAATAVNGIPDLVTPGSTGLLAPPAEPAALADCVRWLLDHPVEARRMGQQGRARVLSAFSPAAMCRQLDRAYARLLGLPVAAEPSPAAVELAVGAGDHGRQVPDEHVAVHRAD